MSASASAQVPSLFSFLRQFQLRYALADGPMAFRKAFAMVSSSIGSAAGVGHVRYRRCASCRRFMHSHCRAARSHEQVKNGPVRDIPPASHSSLPRWVTFFQAFVKIFASLFNVQKRVIVCECVSQRYRGTSERRNVSMINFMRTFLNFRNSSRYREIAHGAMIGGKLMQRHEKQSFFS